MSHDERLAAVLPLKQAGVHYADIAKRFGTNKGAVSGLVFRAGYTKLNDRERMPVASNAHAIVKQLFALADSRGMKMGDLVRRSGYSMESLHILRTRSRGARLRTVADLAEALGMELVVRPRVKK